MVLVVLFAAGALLAGVGTGGAAGAECAPGGAAISNASLTFAGGEATATFSISQTCAAATVTLASYEAQSASYSLPQTLFPPSSSQVFHPGGPYTLTVHVPDCFFQVDLVTGDAIQQLMTGQVYGPRKAAFANGGSGACPPPTTTGTTSTGTTSTGTTSTGTTSTGTTSTGTTSTGTTSTGTTSTGTTSTGTTSTGTTTLSTTSTATPPGTTTEVFLPPAVADIAVVKTVDRPRLEVGNQATYTLTVTNVGPVTADDVTLVDVLPSQETLVSVSDAACTGTTVVSCSLGSLAAGVSTSITVVALAKTAGTATNVATVSTTSPETDTANNQAHATVVIRGPFTPPALCRRLVLRTHSLKVGVHNTLIATVRSGVKPVARALVNVSGLGIHVQHVTDTSGRARFDLAPSKPGVLQVRLAAAGTCPARRSYLSVNGAFQPPAFTG